MVSFDDAVGLWALGSGVVDILDGEIEFVFVMLGIVAVSLAAFFLAFGGAIPRAEEEPIFTITFKDGAVSPRRLEVPANRRFQLNLVNNGDTPAEFESNELRKEKVLAPKTTSILVFRTLDPGEYPFFDDFHPDAPQAVLIAK